jgi:hypothetical protein
MKVDEAHAEFLRHAAFLSQMVVTLDAGFIRRHPGVARGIEIIVDRKLVPELL